MKNLLIVLAFLLAPSFAHAVLLNGNFETGSLSPWSTIGDVSVVDSSFGSDPPQGHLQVLITNAPETSFGEHPQSYSGTNSAGFSTFTAFFDILHVPGDPFAAVYEGSGIKQSFIANTDIFLSFTWKFLTDEGFGGLFDPRFYVLDRIQYILFPTGAASLSPTPFLAEFGYETTTIFVSAGPHTLGFGVFDTADTFTNSGLLLDDISFRFIPEPPTWLLLGFGLIVIARVR